MKFIPISEYNYQLPEHRIAKYPLESRDASKLLVYNKGRIVNEEFTNLHQYII